MTCVGAMETRGLIDETLRTNPDYDGLPNPLFILRQSDPGRAAGADAGRWAVLEDACQSQARSLPGLFSLDDPATALRPSTPALLRCMTLVGGTKPGFTLVESDPPSLIPTLSAGLTSSTRKKPRPRSTRDLAGRKGDHARRDAAATELFTEPYMVKRLLQNSLGRTYREFYPDTRLPASWDYTSGPTGAIP